MFGVAVGQIKQRVDIGDAELVTATPSPHDVVPGPNLALGDDAEVETRTVLGDKQVGHLRLVQAKTDAEAGDPWLGDFEFGVSDAVAVTDADLGVGQSGDGEVFPEMTGREVVTIQIGLPELVRFSLINHDRALLAAVAGEVALAVALDIDAPHHDWSFDGGLPNPRVYGLAPPRDVLRLSDVDRNQPAHDFSPKVSQASEPQTSGSPPSIFNVMPVMNVLVIANNTPLATSSGVPIRRTGLPSAMCRK